MVQQPTLHFHRFLYKSKQIKQCCGSGMFIPTFLHPESGSWLFTHPRSRGQKGTGSGSATLNPSYSKLLFQKSRVQKGLGVNIKCSRITGENHCNPQCNLVTYLWKKIFKVVTKGGWEGGEWKVLVSVKDVLLSFNLAVILYWLHFPFPLTLAQSIDIGLLNRVLAANMTLPLLTHH